MSEKEIINVSDCEFYGYDGVCKLYSGSICSKDCSNYPNCYFKQLKRKEQKCERLKEEIKTNGFGCFNIEMSEQLDQLKADNDTLRQFLSKEPLALQALQSAYSSYKKSADVFYEMVKQYKQTLTDIKEIAEEEIECKTYEIENDCFNKTRCKALNEHIDFTKQILQKISQCEVEND